MTKITIDRSVVEQALEALEWSWGGEPMGTLERYAIAALRAALAEPVEEPVAYIHRQGNHWEVSELHLSDDEKARGWTEEPLYTTPPQRPAEPVQESSDMAEQLADALDLAQFYRRRCEAIQAWQSKMRDPERVIVCDILANGKTLDPAVAGDRYTVPRPAEAVQEPVAKVELMTTGGNAGLATRIVEIDDHLRERLRPGQLLYTAPPQRKPLTEEEIFKIFADVLQFGTFFDVARAIERAHKIGGEG